MFTQQKYIIQITKTSLLIFRVTLSSKPKETLIASYPWTNDSLPKLLQTIKKKIGARIRILLDENLIYVAAVFIEHTAISLTRENVAKKAQEIIPENLNETIWDFKEVLVQESTPKNKAAIVVQIIVLTQPFASSLNAAILQTRLVAEAIEPISYSLARSLDTQTNPICVVYGKEPLLLIIVNKGLVVATESIPTVNIDAIQQFIAFVAHRFHIAAKHIVLSTEEAIDGKLLEKHGQKVEVKKLSPIISLALKKDIAGKDEQVLNITIPQKKEMEHVQKNTPPPSDTISPTEKDIEPQNSYLGSKKALLFILLAIIIFIAAAGLYMLQQQENKRVEKIASPSPTTPPISSPTIKPTLVLSPTKEPLDIHAYTIAILNGSSKSGEATNLGTFLTSQGYNVSQTGNAKTNNYDTTEIRYSQTVPVEFKSGLDKVVKNLYANSTEETLQEKVSTDVLIIIGKQ